MSLFLAHWNTTIPNKSNFSRVALGHTERDLVRNKTTLGMPYATITDPTTYFSVPAAPIDASKSFTQLSPSLGATYGLSEATKLFAKSTLGYKPGGYSAYTDANNLRYAVEEAWTSEIGLTYEPNSTWRMVIADLE